MDREGVKEEKMRKCHELISLHFLILSRFSRSPAATSCATLILHILHIQRQSEFNTSLYCSTYLIFVIFLHKQNFWRVKFTPKKRANYDKIHSKLPNFCVITAKYTVNCQFFALNL